MTVHARADEPGGRGALRVATYNVHDLRSGRDAVAHVLRSLRADVVLLQEVPRRLGAGRRLRVLAREAGLVVAASGRGSGGTAVLVHPRLDVVAGQVHRLPVAHLTTRTRGVAVARLRLPSGPSIAAASVHLPLSADGRLDHARLVLQRLSGGSAGPVVVGGDLNESSNGSAWTALAAVLRDAAPESSATFPARAPRRRIDALFVSSDVRVSRARVAGAGDGLSGQVLAGASDHLPVLADLTVG